MDILEECTNQDDPPSEIDPTPSARRDGQFGDAPFVGQFLNSADTLVPTADEVLYECNEDVSRQMWKGRMFENREAFWKAL